MAPLHLCLLLLLAFYGIDAEILSKVGINYGQLGNNLPSPLHSVHLINSRLRAGRVKIYDANPDILGALKNTGLSVSVMLPNELITPLSSNQTLADTWVGSNVVPFEPETKIRYLLVGNEVLSLPDKSAWFNLVAAMKKVRFPSRNTGSTGSKWELQWRWTFWPCLTHRPTVLSGLMWQIQS